MKFRFQCSQSFIGTQAHLFISVSFMAALQRQLGAAATQTLWPAKPKRFIIWPFTEKVCHLWVRAQAWSQMPGLTSCLYLSTVRPVQLTFPLWALLTSSVKWGQ